MEYQHICQLLSFDDPTLANTSLDRRSGYIPPKRPYSFDDMLLDVLDFSAMMLVPNGRVSMWMPTANDDDVELAIPTSPGLEMVSVCVQQFNKCKEMRRIID